MNESQPAKSFSGRSAIVTGATRGIGRAIALEIARRGANVAFNYLKSGDQAKTLVAELEALGVKALPFQLDVGELKGVREMVNATKSAFGKIDGLVNNAGLTRDKLLMMMSEEDWSEVIRTNLTGAFNVARAAIFMMMKAKGGAILNVTSISGIVGMPGQVNYSASKAGLIGMTKALAKEVGRTGIRVNALARGFIATTLQPRPLPRLEEGTNKTITDSPFASSAGCYGKIGITHIMPTFGLYRLDCACSRRL